MGRYYSGDIEGKFWFGVQNSTVGEDRFGCIESNPGYIDYYADEEQLPQINEELKYIEDKMGDQLAKYKELFSKVSGYNNQTLLDVGLDPALLGEYADYTFGVKLRDCITEHGSCSFTAELG
jgi:hypothetical protein